MDTREIIDKIFKDPKTKYELTEFEALGKPIDEILEIYPKTMFYSLVTTKPILRMLWRCSMFSMPV